MPHLKWYDKCTEIIHFPVYENRKAIYTCYKEFKYDNTVTTVGKELEVVLNYHSKSEEIQNENSLVLSILFYDLLNNYYIQNIIIKFLITDTNTGESNVLEVTPITPRLYDENNE